MNKRESRVSIITVVYNGVGTIERTIQSVLNQSYKDIEYIIIDGLSTDGTQRLIEKYLGSISYFVSEKDDGIYDAMNKGIKLATGDIIGIINSDDWYARNAIENIVRYFEQNDIDVVYGKVINIYPNGSEYIFPKRPIENLWFQNVIHHPGVFVKRTIYETLGTFDTKYRISSDYDFLLRLYSHHIKFGYINDIIAYFSIGGITSLQQEKMESETYEISKAHIHECPDKNSILPLIEERNDWTRFTRRISAQNDTLYKLICLYFNEQIDKIIIFGMGIWGIKCYEILKNTEVVISFFSNNQKGKWNTEFNGIKVIPPDQLRNINAYVLIAVKESGDKIKQQLKNMNNSKLKYVTIKELKFLHYNINKSF